MARNDLSESTLGCLIGGAGPAGLGFLFNAIKRGALEQLAQAGTIIVDAGTELGAGKLGDYQIIANSVSDVFLDCLRDPLLAPILAPLQASPTFRHLKLNSQEAPALPIVGQLFQQAAGLVLPWLERQYGIPTWRQTRITEVTCEGSSYVVWLEQAGAIRRVRTSSLVLNLGGKQTRHSFEESIQAMGLQLPQSASIDSSDNLLRLQPEALRQRYRARLKDGGPICVVGGSHSAFSALDNLASALHHDGLRELTLVHRSPIRLFYETAAEALAAGYDFDPIQDICPISKRVNRSGGLRYRAHEIGRQVLAGQGIGGTPVKVKTLQLDGSAERLASAQTLFDSAALLVQGMGYQPIVPELRCQDGRPLTLRTLRGGLDSDAAGSPLDQHGQRLKGLHLFGLGSGLAVDPRLGSEASFSGRIYGVWQFHNDASREALESVLERLDKPGASFRQPASPVAEHA